MINPDPVFQIPKKGLYFLSLGGIGEIGANCYLYGCDNKWIMIDIKTDDENREQITSDMIIKMVNWHKQITIDTKKINITWYMK